MNLTVIFHVHLFCVQSKNISTHILVNKAHCESEGEKKREIQLDVDQEKLRCSEADRARQRDIMRESQSSCACGGTVGAVFMGFTSHPDLTS